MIKKIILPSSTISFRLIFSVPYNSKLSVLLQLFAGPSVFEHCRDVTFALSHTVNSHHLTAFIKTM